MRNDVSKTRRSDQHRTDTDYGVYRDEHTYEIVRVGYVDGEEEGHLAFYNDEFLREDKADGDA